MSIHMSAHKELENGFVEHVRLWALADCMLGVHHTTHAHVLELERSLRSDEPTRPLDDIRCLAVGDRVFHLARGYAKVVDVEPESSTRVYPHA